MSDQNPQGQGAPTQAPTAGGHLTEEQLAKVINDKVAPLVSQQVNQAITARNKVFEKQLEERFEKFGDKTLEKLDERLSKFSMPQQQTQSAGGTDPDEGGKKKGKGKDQDPPETTAQQQQPASYDIEKDPKFLQQQREFKALKDKFAETEKRETETRLRAREQSRRQGALEQLAKGGLDAMRAKQALAYLDAEGLVRYESDQSDKIVFGKHVEGEVSDELEVGVGKWLKTDEAKTYLPPKNARGSGDLGGGGAPNPGAGSDLRSLAGVGLQGVLSGRIGG